MRYIVAFDTEVFCKDQSRESARWRQFRSFRKDSSCRVIVPAVVVTEMMRHFSKDLRGNVAGLKSNTDSLIKRIRFLKGTSHEAEMSMGSTINLDQLIEALTKIEVNPSRQKWRISTLEHIKDLVGNFDESPIPNVTHEALVERCCIEERRPFRSNNDKDSDRSYRDSLIWLSLVEVMVENADSCHFQ